MLAAAEVTFPLDSLLTPCCFLEVVSLVILVLSVPLLLLLLPLFLPPALPFLLSSFGSLPLLTGVTAAAVPFAVATTSLSLVVTAFFSF